MDPLEEPLTGARETPVPRLEAGRLCESSRSLRCGGPERLGGDEALTGQQDVPRWATGRRAFQGSEVLWLGLRVSARTLARRQARLHEVGVEGLGFCGEWLRFASPTETCLKGSGYHVFHTHTHKNSQGSLQRTEDKTQP